MLHFPLYIRLISTLCLIAATPVAITHSRASTPPPEDEPAPTAENRTAIPPADYTSQPTVSVAPEQPTLPPNAAGVVALIQRTASLSTLANSITASGLSDMLNGAGALTVFAPTNEAFSKLPADARAALMNAANKTVLARILSHHVVVGALGGSDLAARISRGGGATTLTMLTGEPVTAELIDGAVVLKDRTGNSMRVVQSIKTQNNSMIHLVDGLVMPQPRKYTR